MNASRRVDFSAGHNQLKRLDEIGWGIFLIMIGAIWLVPSLPQGTWLIGTGALLLLLNAVRYSYGAEWSGFSTILGILALAAGVGDWLGIDFPLFAICLVAVGISMVLRAFFVTQPA